MLGVSTRAVQKWIKAGKFKGAEMVGKSYLVPYDSVVRLLTDAGDNTPGKEVKKEHASEQHLAFPLTQGLFCAGEAYAYIEGIKDEDERQLALAEYYYYSGNIERSLLITESYVSHENAELRLSAALLYSFSHLSLDHAHRAHIGFDIINSTAKSIRSCSNDRYLRALAVFSQTAVDVLMHTPTDIYPLMSEMIYLPEGLRQFAAYLMAQNAYTKKNYERALAIAETTLAYSGEEYPIAYTYLLLIECIALVKLKRTNEAKEIFIKAYNFSRPDYFIMHFAENHMFLGGLMEVYVKREHPEDFKALIALTHSFSNSWKKAHNNINNNTISTELTTTEISIAMLFNQSWTVKEISSHMEMSERMVKYHLSIIYQKLGISSREELRAFVPV